MFVFGLATEHVFDTKDCQSVFGRISTLRDFRGKFEFPANCTGAICCFVALNSCCLPLSCCYLPPTTADFCSLPLRCCYLPPTSVACCSAADTFHQLLVISVARRSATATFHWLQRVLAGDSTCPRLAVVSSGQVVEAERCAPGVCGR